MPTCPECQNFLLAPGRCPRDNKPLLEDTEARKRGIIGKIADRYHVQTLLGEGGMGSVFLATHETLQRKVAIKILRREGQMEEQAIARFKREAKATSLINHRHVISVLDFGELLDRSAFYVMEHLDGKSLADAVDKEAPFPLPRALSICVQVAKGLKAAHDKGVVHRDLKPDNIFLVANQELPDFVKILDFGVAKIVSDSQQLTKDGMLLGTPDYMAPEQAIGMPTDLRVDIYALGIMLYEMITGDLPFTGQTFMEVLSQHIHNAPPLIEQRHPEIKVPGGVDDFIQKALKKRPENRFQTMQEVLDALFAISNIQEMLPSSVQMSQLGMSAVPSPAGPVSKKMTAIPGGASRRLDAVPSPGGPLSRKIAAVPDGGSRRVQAVPQPSPSAESLRNESTYTAQPPRSVPSGGYQSPAKGGQIAHSASFSTLPKTGQRPAGGGSAAYQIPRALQARPVPIAPNRRDNSLFQTTEESAGDLQSTRAFIQQANPPALKKPGPVPNLFDSLEETNIFDSDEDGAGTAEWSSREPPMEDDATHAATFEKTFPAEKKVRPFADTKPPVMPSAPKPEPARLEPVRPVESPRPLAAAKTTEAPRSAKSGEVLPPTEAKGVSVVALPPEPPQVPEIQERPNISFDSVPLAPQPTNTPSSGPSKWAALGAAFASFLVMGVILYFLVLKGS